MQYIFASDTKKGYGLLYTDGDRAEAERVCAAAQVPDGEADVFGFTSFGVNDNQPLFFRIRKDESYPRGAYFVHGIYRDADRDYYSGGGYKKDLFRGHITQDQLDRLRSDGDTSFLSEDAPDIADGCPGISERRFTELLERVCCNADTVVGVDDGLFRHGFSKHLMARLYEYMPPSAIKSCTFVSGTLKGDFRVRIVPKSMLDGFGGEYIDITDEGGGEVRGTELHRTVAQIRSMGEKERSDRFADFERLTNGYYSYYQPEKLRSFCDAVNGDADRAKEIVGEYLSRCGDPKKEDIPPSVRRTLEGEYSGYDSFRRGFVIASGDNFFDPASLAEANGRLLGEWYVLSPDGYGVYLGRLFRETAERISLDDAAIQTLGEKLDGISRDAPDESKGYLRDFVKELYSAYEVLREKLDEARCAKEDALAVIRREIASGGRMTDADSLAERVFAACRDEIRRAADVRYDIVPQLMREAERMIREKRRTDISQRTASERNTAAEALEEALKCLAGYDLRSAGKAIESVLPLYEGNRDIFDPVLGRYEKLVGRSLAERGICGIGDPVMEHLASDGVRWDRLMSEDHAGDIAEPILLTVMYVPWDRLLASFVKTVSQRQYVLNGMKRSEVRRLRQGMEDALDSRVYQSGDGERAAEIIFAEAENADEVITRTSPSGKLTGKSKRLVGTFCKYWKDRANKRAAKPGRIIIAAAAALAAAAGVCAAGRIIRDKTDVTETETAEVTVTAEVTEAAEVTETAEVTAAAEVTEAAETIGTAEVTAAAEAIDAADTTDTAYAAELQRQKGTHIWITVIPSKITSAGSRAMSRSRRTSGFMSG